MKITDNFLKFNRISKVENGKGIEKEIMLLNPMYIRVIRILDGVINIAYSLSNSGTVVYKIEKTPDYIVEDLDFSYKGIEVVRCYVSDEKYNSLMILL